MKRTFLFFAAAMLALSVPGRAQTPIFAPTGWKTETRANGALTFTPPDLQAGENYSITTYDSASLGGKTLAEYLRAFAGPVGAGPGKLQAPLKIQEKQGRAVSGLGAYNGPNGAVLSVFFLGICFDGANIHVARTLLSTHDGLFGRYTAEQDAVFASLTERAKAEAGDRMVSVPQSVREHLVPGGELVPGVYAGSQYRDKQLRYRLRVYVYADGGYRVCDENDNDFKDSLSQVTGVGNYDYNRTTGQLSLDAFFDLSNSRSLGGYCFFGRGADNKPLIFARDGEVTTLLRYAGPPTKRPSKAQETVKAQKVAAARAEEMRFPFIVAPGRGVKAAQIAAILQKPVFQQSDAFYVLLRDGTVHDGLPPVALDQFDVAASKRKQPKTWGRWRARGGNYEASWEDKPFETLTGSKVLPVPPQLRLATRYTGASATQFSHGIWGVTFDKAGRFRKDARGGVSVGSGVEGAVTATMTWDDSGSGASVSGNGAGFSSVNKKKNPNGDREGTYSFHGYSLTLRYDNGRVERIPTFFLDKEREFLWFDGSFLMDEAKTLQSKPGAR